MTDEDVTLPEDMPEERDVWTLVVAALGIGFICGFAACILLYHFV